MKTCTLTILLADLVGSSAHLTAIPHERAVDYLHDATLPIRQAVETHEGIIVKFTGDGYLAYFTGACQALRAAEEIRSHFVRQAKTPSGVPLDGVRIILNTADVTLEDNGDILGDGVALVSRLEKITATNQIYITQAVYEVADDAEFSFEPVGQMRPRGWHRPIMIYQLTSAESSYVDTGLALMITDLHGLIAASEGFPAGDVHHWLTIWGDLHRQAVAGLRGRVRQFVADMALTTFSSADDAVQGILSLQALANIHNQSRPDLPPIHFKAALASGDLILSPTGIVGRLVNHTFDLLNATPRGTVSLDSSLYDQLTVYKSRGYPVTLTSPDGTQVMNAYRLADTPPAASDQPATKQV